MCGIAGFHGSLPEGDTRQLIETMTGSIRHRGPDESGYFLSPERSTLLINTRLSVIDLEGGSQPIKAEDGSAVVVQNGEIYNYQELRDELKREGMRFRTHSDTEVLLAAYRQWGPGFLERLRGMFAIAILDRRSGALLLARDRLGIKPLYICRRPGGFAFSSEINTFRDCGLTSGEIAPESVGDFLALGVVREPRTIYADVEAVEPGTYVTIDGTGLQKHRYYEWRHEPEQTDPQTVQAWTREALVASIKDHLVADIPVCAFLSGGIDSALIVAMAARELDVRLPTFTVGFDDAAYDESDAAAAIASHVGSEHAVLQVEMKGLDPQEIEGIMDRFGQPFGDMSAIPTYVLCRAVRAHSKVALSGDGGDEMFMGYKRFGYAEAARVASTRLPLRAGLSLASGTRALAPASIRRPLGRFLEVTRAEGSSRILAMNRLFAPEEVSVQGSPLPVDVAAPFGCRAAANYAIRTELPSHYLRKVDICSSAVALEARVPFLGEFVHRVSARIPDDVAFSWRQNKPILRRLAREYLPEEITGLAKRGFAVPLDTLLEPGALADLERRLKQPDRPLREFLPAATIETVVDEFSRGHDPAVRSRDAVCRRFFAAWTLDTWLERRA
ncbi:hypothetical protein ABI59_06160 [Acidobacteria bacterium Mor1]|nr:hypothetical protein ABI59_06160 [Acidobacteria bacterium Mor1]